MVPKKLNFGHQTYHIGILPHLNQSQFILVALAKGMASTLTMTPLLQSIQFTLHIQSFRKCYWFCFLTISRLMKLIHVLKPTKQRWLQSLGPCHKSKPKSASTYQKPNRCESQSSNLAQLAHFTLKSRTCQYYKEIPHQPCPVASSNSIKLSLAPNLSESVLQYL